MKADCSKLTETSKLLLQRVKKKEEDGFMLDSERFLAYLATCREEFLFETAVEKRSEKAAGLLALYRSSYVVFSNTPKILAAINNCFDKDADHIRRSNPKLIGKMHLPFAENEALDPSEIDLFFDNNKFHGIMKPMPEKQNERTYFSRAAGLVKSYEENPKGYSALYQH